MRHPIVALGGIALLLLIGLTGAAIAPIGFNDCSGTITSGGNAQVLIAAASRSTLLIQNDSTDPIAFSATTTTPVVNASGSWTLNPASSTAAGGSYGPSSFTFGEGPLYIIGATTNDAFSCHWR